MWELNHKEGWVPKNWCFWTVVLENTLESPSDSKEIQPVNPKGNQPWIFIERTEAAAPILWPPDAKNQLIWKDPAAGNGWRQEEKGMTEDEMVGWHHQLNGHTSLSKLWELVVDREAWRDAVHGTTKSRTRLSHWTGLNWKSYKERAIVIIPTLEKVKAQRNYIACLESQSFVEMQLGVRTQAVPGLQSWNLKLLC